MDLLRFREWLAEQSKDDRSIDFWRVIQRKRRRINISNIRVQGTIYTALLFFFDHFDGSNVPFLENTIKKISQITNLSDEYLLHTEYTHLVDEISYGYDDNDISIININQY